MKTANFYKGEISGMNYVRNYIEKLDTMTPAEKIFADHLLWLITRKSEVTQKVLEATEAYETAQEMADCNFSHDPMIAKVD